MTTAAHAAVATSVAGRRLLWVNGVQLSVHVEGTGPDILLVHGFPDDATVWRHQIPALVAAGYRVIAPDTRGCGASALASGVASYRLDLLVADLLGILDQLGVARAQVVGHDWGAIQAWQLAITHPERVERLVALSVGHPGSYARGGLAQKLKSYYVLLFQLRGVAEWLARCCDFRALRLMIGYPAEFPRVRDRLSRPGRLTAGFNYYRANLGLLLRPGHGRVRIPVVGIWSDGDRFLTEDQMRKSAQYCDAGWQYVRIDAASHWLQLDAPERINALLIQQPATAPEHA